MKKITNKILIVCFLFSINNTSFSQLLQQGDIVVTYKYGQMSNSSNGESVLAVLRAGNTSGAPNGGVWTTPTYAINPGNKPNWITDNILWSRKELGAVFGITIDDAGNIYVTSTSIYGGTNAGGGTVAGTESNIYEISGSGPNQGMVTIIARNSLKTPAFVGTYGNIKFAKINGNDFLYVTDWGNGLIHRLQRVSGNWTYKSSFNPHFGIQPKLDNSNTDAMGQLAYGLAIRVTTTGHRLYYARIGNKTDRGTTNPNGYSNEVWAVDLDNSGDFIINNIAPWGEFLQNIPGAIFKYENPFADLAFSSDGRRMLLGQQSLTSLTSISAHRSSVVEVEESGNNSWISTGSNYPTGNILSTPMYINQTNAVGGVSYSNNILFKNNEYSCDTTVLAVSDFIQHGSYKGDITTNPNQCIYGIMCYPHGGILNSSYNGSLLIDEDDEYLSDDKYNLGDVEVYNLAIRCSNCQCKPWPKEAFEISLHDGDISNTFTCGQRLTFKCNNIEGVLSELYSCDGNCTDSTIAQIYKDGQLVETKKLPFDLSYFNKYQSGNFEIRAIPYCGTTGNRTSCDLSCSLFFSIVCTPPECCSDETLEVKKKRGGTLLQPSLTGYSTLSQSFTINGSKPVSELRVMIEDFKLSASNPACLKCENPPATWGSILTSALNGNSLRLDLPGNTGTSTGPQTVADYREMIYKPGALFSIRNSMLTLNLALPTASELECCTIYATLWVKFTFKDDQCRECIQYLPLNITIKQGKLESQQQNDNPVLDKKGNPTIIKSNI